MQKNKCNMVLMPSDAYLLTCRHGLSIPSFRVARQASLPFSLCDDTIQFFEKFLNVYFMDTCAVSQFLKVCDLALEAVETETLEYRNHLRIPAANLPDLHIFANHCASSLRWMLCSGLCQIRSLTAFSMRSIPIRIFSRLVAYDNRI